MSGLYYLRARYYNPRTGRFTQEDVIYNDGLNLYAYCNSNPVIYSDPSGFAKKSNSNCDIKDGDGDSQHLIGENGTQVSNVTTGQKGGTERVDVENPAPGRRKGDLHYHEEDNTKWKYDFDNNNLTDYDGIPAPPKVQKKLKEDWVKKAIKKGKKILGED